jgi:hypothetical protein
VFDELIDDRIGNDVVSDVPRANEVPVSRRRDVDERDEEFRRRP